MLEAAGREKDNRSSSSLSYRDAGVDVDAGNRAVEEIREAVNSTRRPEVLGDLGGFGGLFAPNFAGYKEPVLVSGTDGVGTKLQIAFMTGRHDTVGQDVVAMCVNDVLAQGAEPLFFLDYLAVGKLNPFQVKEVVSGVAAACRESGCALIGGETAELAGFYSTGEYDIAGFCVGVADRAKLLPRPDIVPGDALIGLPSGGLHSNGFSLVRKICFERMKLTVDSFVSELGRTLGEELLKPTRLYPKIVLPLLSEFAVKGIVHVTGGGFYDNIPRILPEGTAAEIDTGAWPIPAIFELLRDWGSVANSEMFRTFNMGIGLLLVAPESEADGLIRSLASRGEPAYRVGSVTAGDRCVNIPGV
ncbi:MAG: phosphoribosylformylglycinamidine cyclo-ligase [Synergistaceae bacterium]|jgi:phosphoribosylformylglycinamidine cyclo-ligase|nr:phosphoribosylformylglycinamidine cyclo-ligase [Synergistaceae bacterium]